MTFAPGTQVRFTQEAPGGPTEDPDLIAIPVGTTATVISSEVELFPEVAQVLFGLPESVEWVKLEFNPEDFVPPTNEGADEFSAGILEAVSE